MRIKKHLQLIVPILILMVIGGIWVIKNRDEAKTSENQKMIVQNETNETNETIEESIDELEATRLDLEELKSYGLPILIDFGADQCTPCKEMAPVLKELNEAYKGKVIVKFVDVWKYPELVGDFPVQLIPTQFFFDKDGNPYVPKDPGKMGMQLYEFKETKEHVFTAHQGGMTKDQILEVFSELGVEP